MKKLFILLSLLFILVGCAPTHKKINGFNFDLSDNPRDLIFEIPVRGKPYKKNIIR